MPQVILLQNVDKLGEKGDVVDVSAGYLRNFLVPRKLAQQATKGRLDEALRRHREEEQAKIDAVERAEENAALLTKTVLTISKKAGEDGQLFGSVTTQDIANAIRLARGIRVDKRKIHLEEPIKNVGTYMVVVELTANASATVKTIVTETQ